MKISNDCYYRALLRLSGLPHFPVALAEPPKFYYLKWVSHTASARSSLIMHKGISLAGALLFLVVCWVFFPLSAMQSELKPLLLPPLLVQKSPFGGRAQKRD